MDQLADILRARACVGALDGQEEEEEGGVRALLRRLDEAAASAPPAAASAADAAAAATQQLPGSTFGVDVSIHGPGAAGSTHLANFLHREARMRCNLLIDPDCSRHAPWPPPPPPPSSLPAAPPPPRPPCLVYLYSNDPLLGVASFFRRGIAREQALKTTGAAALAAAPAGEARDRARAALSAAAAAAAAPSGGFPRTLDELLERGEDVFGLDAHLEGWLSRPAAADIVFLRYEGAFEPRVARGLFRRLLLLAAARARRRANGGDDEAGLEAEAERLAKVWCGQRRDRRTALTAEQRAQGQRKGLFAAYEARVAALPHGGCFVRPADPSSRPRQEWEAL